MLILFFGGGGAPITHRLLPITGGLVPYSRKMTDSFIELLERALTQLAKKTKTKKNNGDISAVFAHCDVTCLCHVAKKNKKNKCHSP